MPISGSQDVETDVTTHVKSLLVDGQLILNNRFSANRK